MYKGKVVLVLYVPQDTWEVAVELSASLTHHEDGVSGKTSTPPPLSLGKEPSLPIE
jgi:hypothetical protein